MVQRPPSARYRSLDGHLCRLAQLPPALIGIPDLAPESVIGPRGALDPGTSLEAMYVCAPVYLPDEFSACEEPDEPIVIAWLIPLFKEEAAFARTHGWEALERLLVENDPDLTDWHRPPLPVH
ncbi:suppressor of fused domain protein [Arthrobacter sp. ISL-48]|uniref:suppressor of fused domain protein n=1 Tax=Arthrobacter sp. ISL-48 TaxID=2819110 RepID=UPI001BEA9032|nr:suppressor of fused domain protein [Arthrobacter sp. ISL-48]MBT2534150.1 suppressor of fused domain protein [Arthrobacter sp. ISL-48]